MVDHVSMRRGPQSGMAEISSNILSKKCTNDWMGLELGANHLTAKEVHNTITTTEATTTTTTTTTAAERLRWEELHDMRIGDERPSTTNFSLNRPHDQDRMECHLTCFSIFHEYVLALNSSQGNDTNCGNFSATDTMMTTDLHQVIPYESFCPTSSPRSSCTNMKTEYPMTSRYSDPATCIRLHSCTKKVDIDQITSRDVLFGRGRHHRSHVGNTHMRQLARSFRRAYEGCQDRDDKTYITRSIVDSIHVHGGRFLKYLKEGQYWVEVSDEEARQKVSHVIRDDPAVRVAKRNKSSIASTMTQYAPLSPSSLNLSEDEVTFLIDLFVTTKEVGP